MVKMLDATTTGANRRFGRMRNRNAAATKITPKIVTGYMPQPPAWKKLDHICRLLVDAHAWVHQGGTDAGKKFGGECGGRWRQPIPRVRGCARALDGDDTIAARWRSAARARVGGRTIPC